MEDGEVIGPPQFESWRCAFVWMFIISKKKRNDCPAHGHFHDLCCFFVEQIICPKMTQKCLGVLGGHPRPIRAHIWPIWEKQIENSLPNNNKKSYRNRSLLSPYTSSYVHIPLSQILSQALLSPVWRNCCLSPAEPLAEQKLLRMPNNGPVGGSPHWANRKQPTLGL